MGLATGGIISFGGGAGAGGGDSSGIQSLNSQTGPAVTINGANGAQVLVTGTNILTVDVSPLSGIIPATSGIESINGDSGPHIDLIGVNGVEITPLGGGDILFDVSSISGIGGGHTLQAAYDGGNEIVLVADAAGYNGVVLRETLGIAPPQGTATPENNPGFAEQEGNHGIAVSGGTNTPLNPSSYGMVTINPECVLIRSSGATGGPTAAGHILYIGRDHTATADRFAISTSGRLNVAAIDGINLTGDSVAIIAEGDSSLEHLTLARVGPGDIDLTHTGAGDIDLSTTFGTGDINSTSAAQVLLSAFQSSGQLAWRFGPYQAWHVNPSTNGNSEGPLGDGFFPIPHSGQIVQMILENAGGGSVNKFSADFVNTSSGQVSHSLGSRDVVVSVRINDAAGRPREVTPDDIIFDTPDFLSVLFNTPQTFRVVVVG